jgi:hypothetical protein
VVRKTKKGAVRCNEEEYIYKLQHVLCIGNCINCNFSLLLWVNFFLCLLFDE